MGGICESNANLVTTSSTSNLVKSIGQHNLEKETMEVPPGHKSTHSHELQRRKDSLQKKIKVLSVAKEKIDALKQENTDLKIANGELDEMNGELKENIDSKRKENDELKENLKEMTAKILTLQKEKEQKEQNEADSINDILYKVQGGSLKKAKYTKMQPKFVCFINKINHLFYYDQFGSNSKLEPKCMIVRDISTKNDLVEKGMENSSNSWFLVIGIQRIALFVTESITTRDKWVNFITSSLGKDKIMHPEPLRLPVLHRHHVSAPDILRSPRSGTTKIMLRDGFEFNSFSINYPPKVTNCTISNNGHTVQINVGSKNKCILSVNAKKYQLKHFLFLMPSEHTIDDQSDNEMELHLVHTTEQNEIVVLCFIFSQKAKFKANKLVLNAPKTHWILPEKKRMSKSSSMRMSKSNKGSTTISKKMIKIIGIKKDEVEQSEDAEINESDDDETDIDDEQDGKVKVNEFLQQFWDQMPSKKTKQDIPLINPLNFDFLFKNSSDNFRKNIKTNQIKIDMEIYEYFGTLRTPPYTEGVRWMIAKKTHFINHQQLSKLKKIWYGFL